MKEIKIKDIDKIEKKYLQKFGLAVLEKATLSQASKLFVNIIKDFKDGKLSSDELSSLGFELFHKVAKKNPDTDLFQASLSASELIFSLRNEAVYSNLPSYLADIDKFYEANK